MITTTPIGSSPTLHQAAEVAARVASGQTVYSLSTPTFDDRSGDLKGVGWQTGLSSPAGLPALRKMARQNFFSRWHTPDHECWISSGCKAAIFSIFRRHANPGDNIVVVSPHWPSYDDLARGVFCSPVHFQTSLEENFEIDAERLDAFVAGLDRRASVLVLSNPGNPTGKVHCATRLQSVVDVTERHGIALVVDESFSETVHDRDAWLETPNINSALVYIVNSFSKNYHLQGLRLGACLCPQEAFEDLVNIHQTVNSSPASLSQAAALVLGQTSQSCQPAFDLSLQWARTREFVQDRGWKCWPSQGSFYCFPRISDFSNFRARASAANVFFLDGDTFGSSYENHLRLCFCKPLDELDAIFSALAA